MLASTLIVLVIGQKPTDPSTVELERAMRRVLSGQSVVQIDTLAEDPPDQESVARAANADGVVELLWSADGTGARIHCYLRAENRWLDRQISFGVGRASPQREAIERGRLLGFAVATMFVDATEPERKSEDVPASAEPEALPEPPAKADVVGIRTPEHSSEVPGARGSESEEARRPEPGRPLRLSVEFAGIASAGVGGLGGGGSGLGASVGLRLGWLGPLSGRLFVAGRSGNMAPAQASARTALLGAGLAFSLLPETARIQLGVRTDLFASYLEARHLSDDDMGEEAVRSRWLPGADLIAEGGFRLGGKTALFAGFGVEGTLGRTDIYTHGNRVAAVPQLLAVGELGLRTQF